MLIKDKANQLVWSKSFILCLTRDKTAKKELCKFWLGGLDPGHVFTAVAHCSCGLWQWGPRSIFFICLSVCLFLCVTSMWRHCIYHMVAPHWSWHVFSGPVPPLPPKPCKNINQLHFCALYQSLLGPWKHTSFKVTPCFKALPHLLFTTMNPFNQHHKLFYFLAKTTNFHS